MNINNENKDEISIFELLNALWSSKKVILFSMISVSLLTYLFTLQLTDKYSSSSIVAENNSDSSKDNSSYGAIASLAGINLSTDHGLDKTELAIVTIKSLDFFEKSLYSDNLFLKHLMAIESYDQKDSKINYDYRYDKSSNSWNKDMKPSLSLAHKVYLKNLSINEEDEAGFYKISFKSNSPSSSKFLLSSTISTINKIILDNDKERNEESLKYLKSQLSAAKETELKRAIANLVEEKIKKRMMIEASDDYVFEIIDSPRLGIHSEPSRIILSILSALISLIIMTLIVITHYFNGKSIELNFLPPRIINKKI